MKDIWEHGKEIGLKVIKEEEQGLISGLQI